MRKQVIAATTTIVVDIATTTTSTIAFARGGEGQVAEAMAVEVTALATRRVAAVSAAVGSR